MDIRIGIPIPILKLGFYELTTELGQLLISGHDFDLTWLGDLRNKSEQNRSELIKSRILISSKIQMWKFFEFLGL